MEESLPKHHLWAWIIVTTVAVISFIVIGLGVRSRSNSSTAHSTPSVPASSTISNIDFGTLPDRFPPDVPFFREMLVTENFTVSGRSSFETARAYISALSAPEAFSDYQKYFISSGWHLLSMNTVGSEKTVTGDREQVGLLFSVQPGPYQPTSTAEIKLSFTYPQ